MTTAAAPAPDVKTCPRCAQSLPAAAYGRNKNNPGGLSSYCRLCVNALGRERTAKKGAPLQDRPCRLCGQPFPPARRTAVFCGPDCRAEGQRLQKQSSWKAWYDANWDTRRAQAEAWKKANPDKCRAHRARSYQKHKAAERLAHDAWVAANRERFNRMMREYALRKGAIAEGKARFGAEGFFLLVRSRAGFWRADVPGWAIGRTEQIVARYERVQAEELDQWVVYPPIIATEAQRRVAARLARCEKSSAAGPPRRRFRTLSSRSAAQEAA